MIEYWLMNTLLKKYIGDRAFYRRAMTVMMPILLQNVVTNFVSMLDNIMVGQTGTASMSGVAIVGQLFTIFYLVIFGMISGPGIYCAQYWGAGDDRSFKAAFRFKFVTSIVMCFVCMAVMKLWGNSLIGLYLTGEEAERMEVLLYAQDYLEVMLWGMVPYTLSSVYASTLRETGRTAVPMVASWVAVAVNLFLNWVLIFGNLGAPVMGVRGAALATVISRLCETAVNMIWSHTHGSELRFTQRILDGFPMPRGLLKDITIKSLPLMLNETLWCIGSAMLMQIYSTRGLTVVAALNIAYVLLNLFTSVAFSSGTVISIMVAQELGAGETEKAVDTDRKLLVLGVGIALSICAVIIAFSGVFPRFYNTTPEIRSLAARLICIMALILPLNCFAHGSYFTMRSGGKTLITFLFDSGFSWVIQVPVAYTLAHYTGVNILLLYALSESTYIFKCIIGGVLVHRRYWVNNLTGR